MPDAGDAVQIRVATADDADALVALYTQLASPSSRLTRPRAIALLGELGRYPDYHVYLAFREAHPLGTFALMIMPTLGARCAPAAVVEDVVVDAGARGAGVGRAMMEFAMERARRAGCYKLVLSSNLARTDAHRFYESLGFRRHGVSFAVEL
ncbi:MAG: GNAT family N-acetyltransferase [Thermoanaerobaculia bacterium]